MARFSPDGQLIATAGGQGIATAGGSSLRLWDGATGQLVRELSAGDNGIYSVAFSPADDRLLAVGYAAHELARQAGVSYVSLWDIDAGTELARLPGATDLPGPGASVVGALAFSPDGKYLVAGFGSKFWYNYNSFPNPLKVWEVASRRMIHRLGQTGYCLSLNFSRDGRLLASGSRDGTAIIWSTETWKRAQTLPNPAKNSYQGMVEDVAFSPDGKILALASGGGNVQLWDVPTGKLLEPLKGHSSAVHAVVFSPDGRTLASGSRDQTARLWNVATRRQLMQLDPGSIELGGVVTLAFSPDGKQLLAGGWTATAFWSATPIVWNDSDRAAEKLRLLLHSNADFQSRIRMLSENLRLHEALSKLDANDVRVQAALAATQANWYALRARRGRRPPGRSIGCWLPIQPNRRPGCARPGCFAWRRRCCISIGLPSRPCCCKEAPNAVPRIRQARGSLDLAWRTPSRTARFASISWSRILPQHTASCLPAT